MREMRSLWGAEPMLAQLASIKVLTEKRAMRFVRAPRILVIILVIS